MQFLILLSSGRSEGEEILWKELIPAGLQILQRYGPSVLIVEGEEGAAERIAGHPSISGIYKGAVADEALAEAGLGETERLGIAAWNERQSPRHHEAKQRRKGEGLAWDHPDYEPEG